MRERAAFVNESTLRRYPFPDHESWSWMALLVHIMQRIAWEDVRAESAAREKVRLRYIGRKVWPLPPKRCFHLHRGPGPIRAGISPHKCPFLVNICRCKSANLVLQSNQCLFRDLNVDDGSEAQTCGQIRAATAASAHGLSIKGTPRRRLPERSRSCSQRAGSAGEEKKRVNTDDRQHEQRRGENSGDAAP